MYSEKARALPNGPARRRLERKGHGDVDLGRLSHIIEQRLIGREPEDGTTVRSEFLERHERVVTCPNETARVIQIAAGDLTLDVDLPENAAAAHHDEAYGHPDDPAPADL